MVDVALSVASRPRRFWVDGDPKSGLLAHPNPDRVAQTAKATIPPTVLARAHEVIE